jgi:hypothetical protein
VRNSSAGQGAWAVPWDCRRAGMHGTVLPVAFRASPAQRPALVLGVSESTDDDAVGGGPGARWRGLHRPASSEKPACQAVWPPGLAKADRLASCRPRSAASQPRFTGSASLARLVGGTLRVLTAHPPASSTMPQGGRLMRREGGAEEDLRPGPGVGRAGSGRCLTRPGRYPGVLELLRPSTPVAMYGPCWERRPCSGAPRPNPPDSGRLDSRPWENRGDLGRAGESLHQTPGCSAGRS